MSAIGLDSWAVDLKDVGAIYPWQGTETAMVVIAVALWIDTPQSDRFTPGVYLAVRPGVALVRKFQT